MKLGFIGLGLMGKPMAHNLLKHGHTVTVYDINPNAMEPLIRSGAAAVGSPQEVASASEVIFTILLNNEIVKTVVFGENGIIHGAAGGSILVDMSSISPIVTREIASRLKEYGIHMMDAPVSGGEAKAEDGTLAIMVGGEREIFERVEPLLAHMGKSTLIGGHGSGTTAKLANQIMVNANIAAMCEAMVLAAKSGIDIEKMYQAIRSGMAGSAVLDVKMPMLLQRNFQPGGRIDMMLKDMTNVMETADFLDLPLPLTQHVVDILQELIVENKPHIDHVGMVQYYEKRAGVIVN